MSLKCPSADGGEEGCCRKHPTKELYEHADFENCTQEMCEIFAAENNNIFRNATNQYEYRDVPPGCHLMANPHYLKNVGIWFNPGLGGVKDNHAWPVHCSACKDPIPDWKYKIGEKQETQDGSKNKVEKFYGCDEFVKNRWCSEDRMQLPEWMGTTNLWQLSGTGGASPLESCCGCGAISEPCPASHPFAFSPKQGMSGCCQTADPKTGKPLGQNAHPELWKRANTCRDDEYIMPDEKESMANWKGMWKSTSRSTIWLYRAKTDHVSDCLDPVPQWKLIWSKETETGTLTCHDFRRRRLCSPQRELMYNNKPMPSYDYASFLREYGLTKLTDEKGYSPFEACCACGATKPLRSNLNYNNNPEKQLLLGTELHLLTKKFDNTTVKANDGVVTVNTMELDSMPVPTRPFVLTCRDAVPEWNLEGKKCSYWNAVCTRPGMLKVVDESFWGDDVWWVSKLSELQKNFFKETHKIETMNGTDNFTLMEACCECGAKLTLTTDLDYWEFSYLGEKFLPEIDMPQGTLPRGSQVMHMEMSQDGYTVVQHNKREVWVKEADLLRGKTVVRTNSRLLNEKLFLPEQMP